MQSLRDAPFLLVRGKEMAGRYGCATGASLVILSLSGCTARSAPSFELFGAYFPAWMLCALLGIIAAIAARAAIIASGFFRVLPFQLFACTAIGVCIAVFAWLCWFGR